MFQTIFEDHIAKSLNRAMVSWCQAVKGKSSNQQSIMPSVGWWQLSELTVSSLHPPPLSQYNIFVEDIMVRKVKFICSQTTCRELLYLLDSISLKAIPLVDSKGTFDLTVLLTAWKHRWPYGTCTDIAPYSPEACIFNVQLICHFSSLPQNPWFYWAPLTDQSCWLFVIGGCQPSGESWCRPRVCSSRSPVSGPAGSPSPTWTRRPKTMETKSV